VRDSNATMSRVAKALSEAAGLLRGPQRLPLLVRRLASDGLRVSFEQPHLYSYIHTKRPTPAALASVVQWILDAQRPDGGIAAYYSLFTGYSESYPEVTGYIIPTLYDFVSAGRNHSAAKAAEHAVNWLLTLQLPSGAFPAGLHGSVPQPSVFNSGQILQGLIRAYTETKRPEIRNAAISVGDWLVGTQQSDGSWLGVGAYQGVAHTYYSMVAWALVELSEAMGDDHYGLAAERNLDWVLSHIRPTGWIDGINLHDHPNYLHFIAYAIQGILQTAILRRRKDAIKIAAKSAWVLLHKFETHKTLLGAYEPDFKNGLRFACLTGNAQMSCVWLRLFFETRDPRYLNAALKMNEMLKQLLPERGPRGIVGGVIGSYPLWGAYQPLRYISWGCKFLADALIMEQTATRQFEASACAS
jgi:rhamnogalacturonyl hydrolase YesR